MKNNKLYNSMGSIDEELINEAVNAPKKKRLPVIKLTVTAAAALVVVAVSAAAIVNINKQPDIIAEPDGSDIQVSGNNETDTAETKGQQDENSDIVFAGHYSVPTNHSEENKPSQSSSAEPPESVPASQTSESNEPITSTSETPSVQQGNDEESDMLGFIITDDGKTYMQVFGSSEYTLDRDIGRAGDFRGYYSGLEDNSRVYTVKEDEKILVVKFEAGGSVTLMLREEGLQDRSGYYRYNGLRVDQSVMAALSSNDGKAYSVYVTRPDSEDMYDYVYNGKTLRQMKEELDESWKTEHGKYNPLDEEYQAALHAFLKEKIRAVYDILTAQGIKAELINEVRCEAEMTKEQFEALAASDSIPDEYAFGLASGRYFIDDEA